VSEFTARDLRYDRGKRARLDEKVEKEVLRRFEVSCEEAKN